MHNHESKFRSDLSPETVLEAFRQLTTEKQWRITTADKNRVHVQSGFTPRSAGEHMEVSAEPDGEGSYVHVAVRSRMGVWQLIDWGEAKSFYRQILASLREWEDGEEGTGDR